MDEILPGARLCAYWSQQYRCLYPGVAAQPGSHDYEYDPRFVIVEFDDNDFGRIAIEDVRFLLSEYPIVGRCLVFITNDFKFVNDFFYS